VSGQRGAVALAFSALSRDREPRGEGVGTVGAPADVQVLALARADRHAALEMVYGAYKQRIHTFLIRLLGESELAEDVAQETFTKAFAALAAFPTDQRILPWLYRVANNAAIDQLRRRNRLRWVPMRSIVNTAGEPHAANGPEVAEREHISVVLRGLPVENAAALLLHALEGYSYKEIAAIQGCSMTAVRSRIARARQAFREGYATK
jgi:RNA polymerase sigma-70 factor (ECF subfamily)